MRFRNRVQMFFQGRNGADQLNQCLLWGYLGIALVNMFVGSHLLYLFGLALLVWSVYRMLSRNIYQRQRENRAFLSFFGGIRKRTRLMRNRWRDRKTHVYKQCPKCRNTLRLPRIKGGHTVCCPCCGNRFEVNV